MSGRDLVDCIEEAGCGFLIVVFLPVLLTVAAGIILGAVVVHLAMRFIL